jgi:hypothetical protein
MRSGSDGLESVRHSGAVRWDDLRRQAPRLASVAHDRLIAPGVLLVVTIRRDGTPRLSPVEPLVSDGDLWLSMMWQSRKATDLLRDDRILVHSITTTREGNEGEVKVRGRATPIDDPATRARYCDEVAALGWRPEEPHFHLFCVEIINVTFIRYAQTGDQHVTRWPPGSEFVRRSTSPTSVGAEEPVVDLFRPE